MDDDEDPLVTVLGSGSGRSPVYRWLKINRPKLQAAITKVGGRPNWHGLAALLYGRGILDGHGKPPTAATVRTQWRQVQIDMGFDKLRTDLPGPANDPIPPAFNRAQAVAIAGGRIEPPMPEIVETEDEPFFAGGPKTSKGGK